MKKDIRKRDGKIDYSLDPHLVDLNLDGYKELVVSVRAGFSLQPRQVFSYNLIEDTITSSPKSGNISGLKFHDLDDDGAQ